MNAFIVKQIIFFQSLNVHANILVDVLNVIL